MRRLNVLLTDAGLAEVALRAASECDILATTLSDQSALAKQTPTCDVWLTDLSHLHALAELSAGGGGPLVWLAVDRTADLFGVLPDASSSVVGLIRTTHVAEDLAVSAALAVPQTPLCRDAASLSSALVRVDACYALANDRKLAIAFARTVRRHLQEQAGADALAASRFAAAAFEAVDNAMFRGNLELSPGLRHAAAADAYTVLREQRQKQTPYRDRRVWVTLRTTPEDAHLTVRDEGMGFDVPGLNSRGTDAEPPFRTGRGWLVLRHFCTEVRYNDAGNEVTLAAPLTDVTPSFPSSRSTETAPSPFGEISA